MNELTVNKHFCNATLQAAAITEQDMQSINQYTLKELTKEQIFTFKLALCDNDIDRDTERITESCLTSLSALFVGKTVISDHSPKSSNQSARIYNTHVEATDRLNCLNEPLKQLVADCYMVRTKSNEDLILEIEAGIKKEVSIGAAIGEVTCSTCGADRRRTFCEHKKGAYYNGLLCFDNLSAAKDAYEVSFVAVPSQRGAGVVKSLHEPINGDSEDSLSFKQLEIEKIKTQIFSEN